MTDGQRALTTADTLALTWEEASELYQDGQIAWPMPPETLAQHRLHQISQLVDLDTLIMLIENQMRLRISRLNDVIITCEDEISVLTRDNKFLSEQELAEISDYLVDVQARLDTARLDARLVRQQHAALQAACDELTKIAAPSKEA